jgi:hypothetical protein
MEYSMELIRQRLSQPENLLREEILDIEMAATKLSYWDRIFLVYRLQGFSIRACGRKIGKPDNSSRRFKKICNRLARILNGEEA